MRRLRPEPEVGETGFRERAKIYATDVDEEALTQARHALYTPAEVAGVSPQRVERYFERANGAYVFRGDLCRAVIFGRNDLVQDAPISRLDLLVCRNTLMYFNAETQAAILRRFHFALNGAGRGNGYLFLGRAELLLTHIHLDHAGATGTIVREHPHVSVLVHERGARHDT